MPIESVTRRRKLNRCIRRKDRVRREPAFEPLERRALLTATINLAQYVNPFIGTALQAGAPFGAGDTFPGADYPFGLAQWSPDTTTSNPGGYDYANNTIKGFSLTHFSGRGLNYLQDFPLMPFVGTVTASPAGSTAYRSTFSHANESAAAGYYQVRLASGVNVELSVTQRSGIGRFTFPSTPNATLLVSASSANGVTASNLKVIGNDAMSGSLTGHIGGSTKPYAIYFFAQFDRPFATAGTWNGSTVTNGSASVSGTSGGTFVTFDATSNPVVQMKVGLSYVSVANAQLNLQTENPAWDFEAVKQAASDAWNARLNSIQAQGGTDAQKAVFYTALYHTMIHPNVFSDVNGQYIGFDNQVHAADPGHAQYENITTWDNYRSQFRLLSLLDPQVAGDVVRSLINDARQGNSGALPRWEQGNQDSHGMVGDGADVDIATAYAFGATDFDAKTALDLMQRGATDTAHTVRTGLSDYLSLGYVGSSHSGSAAVTLEYASDDFAISRLAAALGDTSVAQTFLQRSQDWKNLFDPATGYITPRDATGALSSTFSPTSSSGFVEGDSAQYTWMVPFNYQDLFTKMGGSAAAIARLDSHWQQLNGGTASPFGFMGNEPEEGNPWAYDFAGAPWKSQILARRIETQLFTDAPGGLPGNDDAGALSSWLVFAEIGLYPEIPGVGGFVVGNPLFPAITLNLAGGHTIQINAPAANVDAPYVQSMQVNGQPFNSTWLPLSALVSGPNATVTFNLGATPNTVWASAPGDAPPSFDSPPKGPHVVGVSVSGLSWTIPPFPIPGGSQQLTDLPFSNIDRIQIKFDENVSVPPADLSIVGATTYTIKSFQYEPSNFSATWVLFAPLPADHVRLLLSGVVDAASNPLDGAWTDSASNFPSGSGVPGSDFSFGLNVLPGDITRDGRVDFNDLLALAQQYDSTGSADLTGDGRVDFADLLVLSQNYGRQRRAKTP